MKIPMSQRMGYTVAAAGAAGLTAASAAVASHFITPPKDPGGGSSFQSVLVGGLFLMPSGALMAGQALSSGPDFPPGTSMKIRGSMVVGGAVMALMGGTLIGALN